MNKDYTVIIEETLVQEFKISKQKDAFSAIDKAIKLYKSGEIRLTPEECQYRQIRICDPKNECTEWEQF